MGVSHPACPSPQFLNFLLNFNKIRARMSNHRLLTGSGMLPHMHQAVPTQGKAVVETKHLNKNQQNPSLKTRACISTDRQENLIPSPMAAGAPQATSSSRNTFISPKSLPLQRGSHPPPPESSLMCTLLFIPLPRALLPALCPKSGLAVRVTFSPEIPGNRLLLLTRRRFFC